MSDLLKRKLEFPTTSCQLRLSHCHRTVMASARTLPFCLKTEIFSSCLVCCNKCPVKTITITSFRVEIFKKIGFSCTCGRTKTEVLVPVYDSWIIYILLPLTTLSYFHHFLRFLLTGENDSNTLRVVAYFFATVFRNIWIHVTGPQCNVTL